MVRVTMMGSGTSSGVPVIGCGCAVCTSSDPRNRRLRPGLKLELPAGVVLVDTPTDLRAQALAFGLPRVDAVVYTHAHADHVFGLDELRIFNFRQRHPIPCYGTADTLTRIRQTFAYVFEAGQEGGGKPQLELVPIDQQPFSLCGVEWLPVPVWHGELEVYGYRIGDFAYVTDCNRIPEESFARLAGVRVLVLDALRYRTHPTHFSLEEAIAAAERIAPERTVFTHLAHDIDHTALALTLPAGMELGHDGLVFEL
jgi:phosphoribosyl 1,2-cyclic phosphate phosphodiesterase